MGQYLSPDQAGTLQKNSSTQVQLNLSPRGWISSTVGGGQFYSSSVLLVNTGSTGAGGLDTGTLTAYSVYYIHYVLQGTALALIASLSKTTPTGYTSFVYSGHRFFSDGTPNVLIAVTAGYTPLPTTSIAMTPGGTTGHTGGFVSSYFTYYLPAGCTAITVKMVGGGGGGSGSGTGGFGSGTLGGAGNSTFLGPFSASGGGGGNNPNGLDGTGGIGAITSPAFGTALQGGNGPGSQYGTGGMVGGTTVFGGSGTIGTLGADGLAARPNTGAGGAGGGVGGGSISAAGNWAGTGGGAGGFVDGTLLATLAVPLSASYPYNVGAAGTAGNAGTAGLKGGLGSSGYIAVIESYEIIL